MDQTTMRENVENDLKDTGNARWTDAELNRAIAKAVSEYQAANPINTYADVAIVADTRRYDLSAQTGYMWCEAVEYPIDDEDGPIFLQFREERATKKVYILPGPTLTTGEDVRYWYAKVHTLAGTSTIPTEHEELIAAGAAAFAVLAWAEYTIDRIGATGWTPRQAREWAAPRVREFRRELEEIKLARVSGLGGGGNVPHWGETV